MKIISALFALTIAVALNAQAQSIPQENKPMYRIQITLGEHVITASLDDTPTARDFIKQLPLTLELEDYGSTEKIAYPPNKLTSHSAPAGIDPTIGDIAYYAPWGNLALFYKDFEYSKGLIRLGHVTSGVEHLKYPGTKQATIKLISND
jgi:hypothetical protein